MIEINRRAFVGGGVACAITVPAFAQQGWPTNKPITLIVPFTPGGSTDILARIIGIKFGEAWGASVVVENRAGAGGSVGTQLIAKAAPDGYTIGMGHIGTLSVNPSLYSNLQYDAVNGLAHISMLAKVHNIAVVHPSIPVKTIAEFVDYLKKNPGKINYGSGGNGSAAHIATAAFMVATGTDMQHVPYRGTAPAVTDLLSGQIQFMMTGGPAVLPHVRAGTLRALGTASTTRLPSANDIPSISETISGFEASQWYGLIAPPGTPAEIVQKINAEIKKAMSDKSIIETLDRDGAEPWTMTPAEFRSFIDQEIKRWAVVVDKAKIRL